MSNDISSGRQRLAVVAGKDVDAELAQLRAENAKYMAAPPPELQAKAELAAQTIRLAIAQVDEIFQEAAEGTYLEGAAEDAIVELRAALDTFEYVPEEADDG